jgi:hypothetical protein
LFASSGFFAETKKMRIKYEDWGLNKIQKEFLFLSEKMPLKGFVKENIAHLANNSLKVKGMTSSN